MCRLRRVSILFSLPSVRWQVKSIPDVSGFRCCSVNGLRYRSTRISALSRSILSDRRRSCAASRWRLTFYRRKLLPMNRTIVITWQRISCYSLQD
uniref:Putative secreted protein n=1 Tax=Anopheles marajoara TaxID=58244 RepID=A0A2M4C9C4_9DIPT